MIEGRGRARRRRSGGWRLAGAAVALAAALLVGVALGMALADGPRGGDGDRTVVRTLDPRPLGAPARTVTVTATG